jgi:hypothetical protein
MAAPSGKSIARFSLRALRQGPIATEIRLHQKCEFACRSNVFGDFKGPAQNNSLAEKTKL